MSKHVKQIKLLSLNIITLKRKITYWCPLEPLTRRHIRPAEQEQQENQLAVDEVAELMPWLEGILQNNISFNNNNPELLL